MIAATTSGDIIVIVAFATILVLVVTGILAAMKWLMRVMQRKPRHSGFSKIFQQSRTAGNGFYTGDETADMVNDKHHRIDRWPSWPCRRCVPQR